MSSTSAIIGVVEPETALSDEQIFQLLQEAEQRLKATMVDVSTSLKTNSNRSGGTSTAAARIGTGLPASLAVFTKASQSKTTSGITPSVPSTAKARMLAAGPRIVRDVKAIQSAAAKSKKANAGKDWFNMPRTNLTPELKRDLQLLKMRSVLDPKRFYKKDNAKKNQIPEFSQVGTIIEGPTEYFSARLTNRERKRTFVEEVLESEKSTQRFKSKYREIQDAKTSGGKNHYKVMKARRRKA